jgi:L-fucose isomerase-like protein
MPTKDGRVAFVPLASTLHESTSMTRIVSSYREWLTGSYDTEFHCMSTLEEVKKIKFAGLAGLFALVLTGGTEPLIEELAAAGKPLIVLAHETMNSLPAAIEALSSVSRPGVKLILGQGRKQLTDAGRFAKAAHALAQLRRHTIGLVGGPSPWLTYSLPDADALVGRLGIKIVEISMREFDDVYSHAPTNRSSTARSSTENRPATPQAEVPSTEMTKSLAIHSVLEKLVKRHGLTAISPRCFDFIKDHGATGCLAVSMLNDHGIVAGCEGDIPSTVGMIVLAEVSHSPAFMGNPSSIHGHRLVLSHCTVATRLTKGFRYATHFESGIGVALAGYFQEGVRVTVARFGRGYGLLRAGGGEIARGKPWSDKLCRTQVEVRMDGSADIFWQRPIGNHLVLALGDHVESLNDLASIAGMEFQRV